MGGTMQRKKIVFFFPAFSSQEATAPLGILAVSTPLLRAGYQVKIIDSTITPHFQRRVIEELKDAICLAVSLVTGPMIRETVEIAKAAADKPDDDIMRLNLKRIIPETDSIAGRGLARATIERDREAAAGGRREMHPGVVVDDHVLDGHAADSPSGTSPRNCSR